MFNFTAAGIKQLPSNDKIYLTFDDGPDAFCTPQVLDQLDAAGAKATFFLVAERAEKKPTITREILSRGHRIGNHSMDHGYRSFFSSEKRLHSWIESAEARLSDLVGQRTVGFRPPAGVVTPPLVRVLKNLNIPLYLWSHRFFDTNFAWTERRAERSLKSLHAGSIILLHDRQSPRHFVTFRETLPYYLKTLSARGWTTAPLLDR